MQHPRARLVTRVFPCFTAVCRRSRAPFHSLRAAAGASPRHARSSSMATSAAHGDIPDTYAAVRVPEPGPSSVMRVEHLPTSKLLRDVQAVGSDAVCIRVHAVGVNPVETYIRAGIYGRPASEFPYTPGHDAAGVVVAAGPAASALRVGDKVYTLRTVSGAYAQYCVAPAKMVFPIPASLSFAQAACVPTPFHTAYRALFMKLRVRPGTTLLVHGATGAVGVATVQMAAAHGCRVIGTSGTAEGARLIAPWCFATLTHGTDTVVEEVMALTGGRGVDHIAEMLANVNLGKDLKMLARNGSVCVVGSRGDVTITPRDLMRMEASITSVMLFAATDEELHESGAYIHAGLMADTLKPLVGVSFDGLERAGAAHDEVIGHKHGSSGKVVMMVP